MFKPSKKIYYLKKEGKTEKEQSPLESNLHHVSFVSCQTQLILLFSV